MRGAYSGRAPQLSVFFASFSELRAPLSGERLAALQLNPALTQIPNYVLEKKVYFSIRLL